MTKSTTTRSYSKTKSKLQTVAPQLPKHPAVRTFTSRGVGFEPCEFVVAHSKPFDERIEEQLKAFHHQQPNRLFLAVEQLVLKIFARVGQQKNDERFLCPLLRLLCLLACIEEHRRHVGPQTSSHGLQHVVFDDLVHLFKIELLHHDAKPRHALRGHFLATASKNTQCGFQLCTQSIKTNGQLRH